MRHFVILVSSYLILIFSVIAIINYYVDPSHYYYARDKYVNKVLSGLNDGKNVVIYANIDERSLQEKFALSHKNDSFDYVILGGSRVMTISEDAFHGSKVLNLGVSGGMIEDIIAYYELCRENGISTNNIILGIDPTLFNESIIHPEWRTIGKYYFNFMGLKTPFLSFDNELIKNLFSPSYFRSSIKTIPNLQKNRSVDISDTYINDGFTRRKDGSIYYNIEKRNASMKQVDAEADSKGVWYDYESLSETRVKTFEFFVNQLCEGEAKVYFFRCPYHPLFYKKIKGLGGIKKGADYIEKYAKKHDIELIGDYNPDLMGYTKECFYDANHVRKEIIDELFKDYFQ